MALSEDQIVRYSRQILLKDVGGVGQERLMARATATAGEGAAVGDAAAYLSAGGTPVGEAAATLTQWPARPSGAAPWVLIARMGSGGVVLARSAEGCAACFEATVSSLPLEAAGAAEPVDGVLGAVAALAMQTAVLAMAPALVGVRVEEGPHCERLPPVACEACR